jgi:SAM-dependent methyltransferase
METVSPIYDDWKDIIREWDDYWSLDKHNLLHVKMMRNAFYSMVIERFLSVFELDKSDKILDLRCGNGANLRTLKRMGYVNCQGVDCSNVAVKLAKDNGLENVRVANPTRLPFKTGEFKLCFGQGNLEHMTTKDAVKALKESKRVSEHAAFSVPLRGGITHLMQQNRLSKRLNLFSLTPKERYFSKADFETLISRVFTKFSVHDFMLVGLLGICRN